MFKFFLALAVLNVVLAVPLIDRSSASSGGWSQKILSCKKDCCYIHGMKVVAWGSESTCPAGNTPSCVLEVCDADCATQDSLCDGIEL